jgi:hypothetical protein
MSLEFQFGNGVIFGELKMDNVIWKMETVRSIMEMERRFKCIISSKLISLCLQLCPACPF